MFNNFEIVQMPLSLRRNRIMVEEFLTTNELRLDDMDYYAAVVDNDSGIMHAGGGFKGDIIKCIAVSDSLRGTGMSQQLISHLISEMNNRGFNTIKVFTKPGNAEIFHSMGFKTIGESSKALFLENGLDGLTSYVKYLNSLKRDGKNGLIVMNANPFTLGHRYLVEQASKLVDNLYVIVVNEDKSMFTTDERFEMVKRGCEGLNNVIVAHGSDYIISSITFPSYFIKKLDDAAAAQIELDLDVMARHIAQALGASKRFVGTEPADELTRNYNEAMKHLLPSRGIEVIEIPRLRKENKAISASKVRNLLNARNLKAASALVPSSTLPFLVAWSACNALKQELELTPKPGLVDNHDNGAHSDMDYDTMLKSINALRPYFTQLATMSFCHTLPEAKNLQSLGIDAEKTMLASTGGVNTHRGALFSIGLAVVAACNTLYRSKNNDFIECWSNNVAAIAKQLPGGNETHGACIKSAHKVTGALDMARDGYKVVLNWLKFYCDNIDDKNVNYKTLLLIMSELDDTNVIHRAGFVKAQQVKCDAQHLLKDFNIEGLEQMNKRFIAENISPGGAADMLSLTLFLSSLTKQDKS